MQSINEIDKLLDIKGKEIIRKANNLVQSELDLFEFNLFISSIGKRKINNAKKELKKLRKDVKSGKIDLEEFEKIAEEF